MKYPECCYRIGNEFLVGNKPMVFMRDITKKLCLTNGCEFLLYTGERVAEVGLTIESENFPELVGITAETLAELAREKGESIRWDASNDETGNIVDFYSGKGNFVEGGSRMQTKDEPLGEFFLRVAKERNYLQQ